MEGYTDKSFFYADPPYLITCATYNEQAGWTENDEKDLLRYLEELDKKGLGLPYLMYWKVKVRRMQYFRNGLIKIRNLKLFH